MAFFRTEVWTAQGLVTHYVLFVIQHASRAVHIAGITANPDAVFMAQVARNLTSHGDGFLNGMRYLVLDNDSKFTGQFRRMLKDAGVDVVHTAFQAPNMNAYAERLVGPENRLRSSSGGDSGRGPTPEGPPSDRSPEGGFVRIRERLAPRRRLAAGRLSRAAAEGGHARCFVGQPTTKNGPALRQGLSLWLPSRSALWN
ncbi:MAG: hypothetical protein ACYTKC_22470 [Planctomycetota bacterium]